MTRIAVLSDLEDNLYDNCKFGEELEMLFDWQGAPIRVLSIVTQNANALAVSLVVSVSLTLYPSGHMHGN